MVWFWCVPEFLETVPGAPHRSHVYNSSRFYRNERRQLCGDYSVSSTYDVAVPYGIRWLDTRTVLMVLLLVSLFHICGYDESGIVILFFQYEFFYTFIFRNWNAYSFSQLLLYLLFIEPSWLHHQLTLIEIWLLKIKKDLGHLKKFSIFYHETIFSIWFNYILYSYSYWMSKILEIFIITKNYLDSELLLK